MGFRCSICKHDQRGAIERAIAAGDSDAAVAKAFVLPGQSCVTIHRHKHMTLSPARMAPADRKAYEAALGQIQLAAKTERVAELQLMVQSLRDLQAARQQDAIRRREEVERLTEEGLAIPLGLAPAAGAEGGLLSDGGSFDVMAFRERRSCLEQIAKELGEWDITGSGARAEQSDGATQTTVFQVVRGDVQQVVTAGDPRKLPHGSSPQMPSLRSLEKTIARQSNQSVGQTSAVVEAAPADEDLAGDGVEG